MKAGLLVVVLLVASAVLSTAAPVYAALPVCTETTTFGGYSYSVTINSCSPSGIPLDTTVTATAKTTDPTIVVVGFNWTNPHGAVTSQRVTPSFPLTFVSPGITLSVPGSWYLTVAFYSTSKAPVLTILVAFTVTFLVLDDLPYGTVAATLAALAGLALVTKARRSSLASRRAQL